MSKYKIQLQMIYKVFEISVFVCESTSIPSKFCYFSSPDTLAYQTLNDGQSLLDEMSRPVKNAMGKDITPDYSSQIKHIQKRLEDLQERKLRCDELSDVRKLKLQQILQLRTCERDADQVHRRTIGYRSHVIGNDR